MGYILKFLFVGVQRILLIEKSISTDLHFFFLQMSLCHDVFKRCAVMHEMYGA
jgi:hypothetical protein